MTLVNIDPHVILHQKTHVPRAVNFFESQKASQHPVTLNGNDFKQKIFRFFYNDTWW